MGIGDDAAVIDHGGDLYLLATVDMLVEDVHFRLADVSAVDLGRRALAVSLSDIAAMGGWPTHALCSLAVSPTTSLRFLEEVYRGIGQEGEPFGIGVVGGNVSRTEGPLVLDVTVLGEVPKGQLVLRSGALPGDALAVTGSLGEAAARRLAQEHPGPMRRAGVESLLGQTWVPSPRVAAGRALAEEGIVHAMLDVSDGLAADLHHLTAAGGVGAVIEWDHIPVSRLAAAVAGALGQDAGQLALSGGEDYELLVALPADMAPRAARAVHPVPLRVIGEVLPSSEGVRIRLPGGGLRPLPAAGWRHF